MASSTSGDDLFSASAGQEAFNGGIGSDTVTYASSRTGVYVNLGTGQSTPLLRIMPFGDSITYGVISSGTVSNTETGGYRTALWEEIRASDLSIDFVGSAKNGPSSLPDRDHQGLRGRTIDYLNRYDESYLASQKPDVVLLMIGTNDLASNTPSQMIAELRDLIVSITNSRPEATVLVSTIPPTHNSAQNAKVAVYNDAMPGLLAELDDTRKVAFVDMRDLTLADVTAPPADSGVHPTASGYEKIAGHWHDALVEYGVFEAERDTLVSIENVTGSNLNDKLVGDGGSNTLSGAAGADELMGNGGNDVLDGGTGGDVMSGGDGNDVYVLDSSLDRVLEGVAGGNDTVRTALTKYSLGNLSNVENLHYTGASRASLIGSHLENQLVGGSSHDTLDGALGADMLIGGLGNDAYVVDNVGDVVKENAAGGRDTVQASVSYTLSPYVEHLTLTGAAAINGVGNDLANTITGNSVANTLYGLGGNDRLYGGAGADTMLGGVGNDSYQVDDAGDVVTENPGAGTDTISSSVTYSLAANVEKLTLSGSGTINGFGNELGNTLSGNAAANTLQGLGGNDTLSGLAGDDRLDGGMGNDVLRGGDGADQLLGGVGADRFDWDNAGESSPGSLRDTVLDFAQGVDKLDFSGVDAISSTAQDDKFSFIGSGEFTGVAGQLRYFSASAGTSIQGDVNGDAIADLEVYLAGQLTMLFSSDIMV